MTPCQRCGKPLLCGCEKMQSTGVVKNCPKKAEAAIWVLVMTPDGKGVEGVTVSNGEQKVTRTNSSGVYQFENAVKQKYTISVTNLMDKDKERYDLPEFPSVEVTPTQGEVTQVLFKLRTKAKLKVELIPGGNFALPKAEVVLHRIVNREYVKDEHRTKDTLEEKEKKAHAGGIADFGTKPADEYRVTVVIDASVEKEYGAHDVDFELLAGEDKLVKIEIERYFKKVRFIGYCIATVPRFIWTGPEDKVLNFELEKAQGRITVPDPGNAPEYVKYLNAEWAELLSKEAIKDKEFWKGRYNGPYTDSDDIAARIELLKEAIQTASKEVGNDDTELKVFLAPECYFLGRYGAYEHEQFGSLIEGLQKLVGGSEWKTWLFAFGTANGVWGTDERKEVFNVSPVVKGGWSAKGDDPSRYTRLMQKVLFSQEMLGDSDIKETEKSTPKGDIKRTQITSDLVLNDFQATHNEDLIGIKLQEVAEDIDKKRIQAKTQINDWIDQRWEKIRDSVKEGIESDGMTGFVRRVRDVKRDVKTDATRRSANATEDSIADLRYLLSLNVYFSPEFEKAVSSGRLENLIYEDSCFSCIRMPGPLLDDVVRFEDKSKRHTKLTFGMETCADHNKQRLEKAAKNVAAHEKPDIHLVPSAGMILDANNVVVVSKGLAFNCDGWNPLTSYGERAAKRGAKIVVEENHLAPRRTGYNPILPHTELWQNDGPKNFKYITLGKDNVKPVAKDASNIFSYRTAEERKAYAEELSMVAHKLLLRGYDSEIEVNEKSIQEKTTALRNRESQLAKEEQQLQQKQPELRNMEQEQQQNEQEFQRQDQAVKQKELQVKQLTPAPQTQPTLQEEQKLEAAKLELEESKKNLQLAKSKVMGLKYKLTQLSKLVNTSIANNIKTHKDVMKKIAGELEQEEKALDEAKQKKLKLEQNPIKANVPVEPARGGELHIYPSQDLPVNY